jgi:hypothetical protein
MMSETVRCLIFALNERYWEREELIREELIREELLQHITYAKRYQSELTNVEVKTVRGSCSQPLRTASGAECCCPDWIS